MEEVINIFTFTDDGVDTRYAYRNNQELSLICSNIIRDNVENGRWEFSHPQELLTLPTPEQTLSPLGLEYYNLTDEKIDDIPHSIIRDRLVVERDREKRKFTSHIREVERDFNMWRDLNLILEASPSEVATLGHTSKEGFFTPLSLEFLRVRNAELNLRGIDFDQNVTLITDDINPSSSFLLGFVSVAHSHEESHVKYAYDTEDSFLRVCVRIVKERNGSLWNNYRNRPTNKNPTPESLLLESTLGYYYITDEAIDKIPSELIREAIRFDRARTQISYIEERDRILKMVKFFDMADQVSGTPEDEAILLKEELPNGEFVPLALKILQTFTNTKMDSFIVEENAIIPPPVASFK